MAKRLPITKEEAEEAVAVYGSRVAAARALGVAPSAVRYHLDQDAYAHMLQRQRVKFSVRYRTDPAWHAKQIAGQRVSQAKHRERRLAQCRTYNAANRARIAAAARKRCDARHAAGLCRCGRPSATPHAGCLSCLERDRAYQQMKRSNKP